jgi:prevent-host-death family protein
MTISHPPTQTMDLTNARQRFGEVVDRVSRRQTRLLVERGGSPVAAIVSPDDLRRLNDLDAEREEMFQAMAEISRAFAGVPVEQLERQVARALAEARPQLRAERDATSGE